MGVIGGLAVRRVKMVPIDTGRNLLATSASNEGVDVRRVGQRQVRGGMVIKIWVGEVHK